MSLCLAYIASDEKSLCVELFLFPRAADCLFTLGSEQVLLLQCALVGFSVYLLSL